MQIRKVIQRRIRRSGNGVDMSGDINAAIAANVGERSSTTHVSSRSSVSTQSPGRRASGDDAEQGSTEG